MHRIRAPISRQSVTSNVKVASRNNPSQHLASLDKNHQPATFVCFHNGGINEEADLPR